MFTGIVEEIGLIEGVKKVEKSLYLSIKCSKVLKETKIGDSIAVNGVCLTVTSLKKESFEADVMEESIRRSNLGKLSIGDKVNLERALSLEARLGGHIVSGHIDGTGEIESLAKEGNAILITIKANKEILKYIVEKGSMGVDGVSLTVIYINSDLFKVGVIPHTGKETILLTKKVGDKVNLECDVVGKYIEKFLRINNEKKEEKSSSISEEFLKSNGFF